MKLNLFGSVVRCYEVCDQNVAIFRGHATLWMISEALAMAPSVATRTPCDDGLTSSITLYVRFDVMAVLLIVLWMLHRKLKMGASVTKQPNVGCAPVSPYATPPR